jgi:hypothetical protein
MRLEAQATKDSLFGSILLGCSEFGGELDHES